MQTDDKGLRATIKDLSAMIRKTASKSEAAALDAIDRAEAALARGQATWNRTKDLGDQVARSIGHAGRTTFDGVTEFNGALGRYGKGVLTDTMEVGRKGIAAKGANEFVDLFVDYVSRRSHALFASIDELNAITKASTFTAWSPMVDMLSRAGATGGA